MAKGMRNVRLRILLCLGMLVCLGAGTASQPGRDKPVQEPVTALVVLVSGLKDEDASSALRGQQPFVETVPVCGKPMISRVLEALRSCASVGKIVIVGPKEAEKTMKPLLQAREAYVPAGEAVPERLRAAAPQLEGLTLVVPSDLPLITADALDRLIERCREVPDADIHYPLVEKKVCEARYPWERRTYARFRDGTFSGGHILVFKADFIKRHFDKIESIYLARKSPGRMLKIIGFRKALRYLVHNLAISDVVAAIERKYDCKARYIITEDVDLATDFNRPDETPYVEKVVRDRGMCPPQ